MGDVGGEEGEDAFVLRRDVALRCEGGGGGGRTEAVGGNELVSVKAFQSVADDARRALVRVFDSDFAMMQAAASKRFLASELVGCSEVESDDEVAFLHSELSKAILNVGDCPISIF